jgi:hypothetical protein
MTIPPRTLHATTALLAPRVAAREVPRAIPSYFSAYARWGSADIHRVAIV